MQSSRAARQTAEGSQQEPDQESFRKRRHKRTRTGRRESILLMRSRSIPFSIGKLTLRTPMRRQPLERRSQSRQFSWFEFLLFWMPFLPARFEFGLALVAVFTGIVKLHKARRLQIGVYAVFQHQVID